MERKKSYEKYLEGVLDEVERDKSYFVEEWKRLLTLNGDLSRENDKLKIELAEAQGERDGLKMVVERLKEELAEYEKGVYRFSSSEYDLITLTSTTPQWELIKK